MLKRRPGGGGVVQPGGERSTSIPTRPIAQVGPRAADRATKRRRGTFARSFQSELAARMPLGGVGGRVIRAGCCHAD